MQAPVEPAVAPTPTPEAPVMPEQIPSSSSKKSLLFALLTLVILLVAGGAYYYTQMNPTTPTPAPIAKKMTPTVTPTPTPALSEVQQVDTTDDYTVDDSTFIEVQKDIQGL